MATPRSAGHGDDGVFQRADGHFSAKVLQPEGRITYVYGRTRAEARNTQQAAKAAVQQSRPLPPDRLTAERFLTDWPVSAKPSLPPATFRRRGDTNHPARCGTTSPENRLLA